jgi:hypothetical protein
MAARGLRWVWLVAGLGLGLGVTALARAQVVDSAEAITLRVAGIGSFDDYAGLLNYLARITSIKAANPILVANDEVTVQLKMQGTVDQLVQQLALENRLTPTVPADGAVVSQPLQYRWSAVPRG